MPLACVWHEEQFYTAGPVPRNDAGDLVNEKPWVSMPLSWNRCNIPIHIRIQTLYKRTFDTTISS